LSIDIANESGVAIGEAALAALARHVLDRLQIHPLAELSVLLVDEESMSDLHQRWMGEPGPTDVLAFPMDELRPPHQLRGTNTKTGGHEPEHDPAPGLLGDVVLCPQIAAMQAQADGHPMADEIELLCIHGILHLLGFDHAEPDEHAAMFSLQEQLLASWREVAGPRAGQPASSGADPEGGTQPGGRGQPGGVAGDSATGDSAADHAAADGSGAVGGHGAAGEQRGGRKGPG
jgi:probable rRNA maturation factor